MIQRLTFCIAVGTAGLTQAWRPAEAPLSTPWADRIDADRPLPEYPRPTMVRPRWQNLNGLWQWQAADPDDAPPFGRTLDDEILTPFPWESALSGLRRQSPTGAAWYRREFEVPRAWRGDRVLLHFGAVDWQATVYVNGRCAGQHRGGFDSFSYDVTDLLERGRRNELLVHVWDPGSDEGIAVGKQSNAKFDDPGGYAYCPASGIWQTVWLEPVPQQAISSIQVVGDAGSVTLTASTGSHTQTGDVEVEVKQGASGRVWTARGRLDQPITVAIDEPRRWSPDDPFLYDLTVRLKRGDRTLDEVASYAGLRTIALEDFYVDDEKNGKRLGPIKRIVLNGEPLFQMGTLDQGYWPEGVFTAPTDEALAWDIQRTKDFGFNMIRKHIKVEPERWYYHCDRLGVLVWQDMPSTHKQRSEAEKQQFEWELARMVRGRWNHPSIVNWIVFNEHWGAYDVARLTRHTMALDPSRLVTGNSGIDASEPDLDYEVGHICDNHHYRPPTTPYPKTNRAIVCGEYGAIGYKAPGHVWDEDGPWVHFNYNGNDAATAEYETFAKQLLGYKKKGLSGAVYTQWTDVENEMNGLYTYDRKLIKLDEARVRAANEALTAD
ncbi:Beta-galactosidase large subunit [Pirellulimonas nuda]|uniref:Beta-galactosidase large subunit n=1 Tax=Pirellulimonas nuda TaxID=2528009 RepID=A0A518DJJ0_9BACT|nr:sugar-binding domain-containing protein [Pirellulimonas nuda]QDU91616.1 Beta-galactosidase large subunit [Pirellulimonas nuda]